MPKIAAVQMTSEASIKANLANIEVFFKRAQREQVELLVLPENFAFMGRAEIDKLAVAENFGGGEIQDSISSLAKKYNLWVIAGTIPLRDFAQKVKSACLVFDHQGYCVARYDKIHLFDVTIDKQELYKESAFVARGNKPVVVDTPIGKIGLTICYDLRFPELYRQLAKEGATIYTVPSAFTATTGIAHWEVLLRARAIENFCYVVAANQGGHHENGRETYGHTMIIEPWGKIIAEQTKGSGMIVSSLDLPRLYRLRSDFPCNEHHILEGNYYDTSTTSC